MRRKNLRVVKVNNNREHKFRVRRVVFLTIIYLGLFITIGREIVIKIQQLSEQQAVVKDLKDNLKEKNEVKNELEQEIDRYERDQAYLAKLARKKFNVSKDNEIIFILPE